MNDIQNAIEAFRAEELQSVEIGKLKLLLNPIIRGYRKQELFLPAETLLFRGRELDEKPSNVRELREPPVEKTRMSRVNSTNKPVFYCCVNYRTPFFELCTKPGATAVLSSWKTNEQLTMISLGWTEKVFRQLNTDRPIPSYTRIDLPVPPSNAIVDEFLDCKFHEKIPRGSNYEYLYKPTVAIAEKMFDDRFDALLYPSIAAKGYGDNLAIKTRCFNEKKLEIKSVAYVNINFVDATSIRVIPLDSADSFQNDGTIEWKAKAEFNY